MAAHLAPHLTGARPELCFPLIWRHLLFIMGFLLSLSNATDLEPRKCIFSAHCNYSKGKYCSNGTCKCYNSCQFFISTPTIKCTEDVECAQLISFSHCVQQTCICLPRYKPMIFGRACELIPESSSTNSPWLDRPLPPFRPGETDYSGVVKMALGAAIVMLAGVILALVWNLYRERRRARRALGTHTLSSRTSRQTRAARRTARSHNNTSRQDNPPRYDDVFFITATESGVRRHEKPPSYEEALRDQQVPIVSPPAYLNMGFNGDVPASAGFYHAVPTSLHVPSPAVSPQSNQSTDSANQPLPETNTLNVTSIINRLRHDGSSSTENNATVRVSVPTSTLRRTKSGRAPEDICPVQCENLVASNHRCQSNPIASTDAPEQVPLAATPDTMSTNNSTAASLISIENSSLEQPVNSTGQSNQK